jgi:hypothetical protein
MTGVDLVVAPARLVPGAFGKLAERVSGREAGAVEEAARQDKLAVAQPQRRLGALDRLCQTTRQNPFQIRLGGVRRAGIGWNPLSVACLHTFQHALALLRRELEQIEQGPRITRALSFSHRTPAPSRAAAQWRHCCAARLQRKPDESTMTVTLSDALQT